MRDQRPGQEGLGLRGRDPIGSGRQTGEAAAIHGAVAMALSLDDTRKVARLARLALSEADLAKMQQQLSAILDYVDQLKSLSTDGVEPLAHPLPLANVFRADVPGQSLTPD